MTFSTYRVLCLVYLTTYSSVKFQLLTDNWFATVVILIDQCSFTNTLKSYTSNTILQVSLSYLKLYYVLFGKTKAGLACCFLLSISLLVISTSKITFCFMNSLFHLINSDCQSENL